MGSPTSLVLECRPSSSTTTAANSVGCRNFSTSADDQACQIQRLEEYLNALEEERRKIEAFKRELPFCMQLLHDTIEAYKERLAFFKPSSNAWSQIQQKSNSDDADSMPENRIIVEEFLPVNRSTDGHTYTGRTADEVQQTPNWMKEAGFMDMHCGMANDKRVCEPDTTIKMNASICIQGQAFSNASKPIFHSKSRSGGAFTPFSREKQAVIQPTARPGALNLADLALVPKDAEVCPLSLCENPALAKIKQKEDVPRQLKEVEMKTSMDKANGSSNGTPARKARRCWSPELHRRFVSALNQLGGPLVATPKQIRELMKVEGLTNDEVKSHLQKYRLHTRRPGASPAMSTHSPQVVVLGSIWVPPEQTTPALYSGLQARPRIYQSTPSDEMCSHQLESPEQINVHFSSAPAYSQSSLQGPLEHNGQLPPLVYTHSDDAGREESVGDDRVSASSSSRAYKELSNHHQDESADKSPDGSIDAHQSQCTSEDDTEIDEERDCETSRELS